MCVCVCVLSRCIQMYTIYMRFNPNPLPFPSHQQTQRATPSRGRRGGRATGMWDAGVVVRARVWLIQMCTYTTVLYYTGHMTV